VKYLKKLLFLFVAILLTYVFVRLVLWQLPGTLADVLSDSETNLKDLVALRSELEVAQGFWKPLFDFFRLDWGLSELYREQSFPIIMTHFFLTLQLSALSLLITFVLSGVFFLFKQKTSQRLSNLLLALPAIAIYPLLVYFLCSQTSFCPAGSSDILRALLIAATAQAVLSAPRFYRELEWEIDQIRKQRFVLVLRAKGLSRMRIWGVHVFSNTLAPFLSLLLITLLGFFSGAVLLEMLFDLPGMGVLLLEAIRARDFALIFPLIMFLSLLHLLTLQSGRVLKFRRTQSE